MAAGVSNGLYSSLSSELKLVLLCSRLQTTVEEEVAIDKLLAEHIDWELFMHLTMHHRLYPLEYRYLSTHIHPKVPKTVVSILRQQTQQNTCKTLQMVGELVRLIRAMAQNRIRTVVMKGFPLAYQLYGDMTLRPSKDLDILVWPEDMDKARKIVEDNGYFPEHPIANSSPAQQRKWMETNQHLEYWNPDRAVCLELHWRLDCHGLDIPLITVENSLVQVQLANQSINILGKEELLLYLVLHGANHAWSRLKWLCDVDIVLRQGAFSWEALYQLAYSLGVNAILNQSIILSHALLDTPIPVNIVEMAKNDTKAQDLAAMALRCISDNDYKPKKLYVVAYSIYQWEKYLFLLQARWRERISFVFRCFLPSKEDFRMIALPEKLYFLYYMLSPFTWLCCRVRNAARKRSLW
ncbi:hypothetical protein SOV_07470 [Sporomusa ovata DSM 2662]|uniref:Nucleotidyltransferase family protein n=1 Tax=Sporomusa ovata TaxID=2378 RepID=A0A0U1L5E8_9FIRM|nr:nucleotidyltransferase family protein [Sporomusa ovata]EQB28401.1 hypothetical protein SOV_1c00850 [Sporomusa ovata DSM 2662]CQR74725.1 hypothetical protein SpAn4DRAFT_4082 [Sporomusa ovata]